MLMFTKKPILYPAQDITGSTTGLYFQPSRVFSEIQNKLNQQFLDLALTHQTVYSALSQRDIKLDQEYQRKKSYLDLKCDPTMNDDDCEGLHIGQSRLREGFMAADSVIRAECANADRSVVISCWSMVERSLNPVLAELHFRKTGTTFSGSIHKWDEFKTKFLTHGINLATIGYHDGANECRVLNNSLKHSDSVDQRLAQYTAFSTLQGESLDRIDFDLQRYFDSCYGFMGDLMEECVKLCP